MNLSFINPHLELTGVLVVAITPSKQLDDFLTRLDTVTQGALSRAVQIEAFKS